jgi:hypothetical protein
METLSSQAVAIPEAHDVRDRYCHTDVESSARLRSSFSQWWLFGWNDNQAEETREQAVYGSCNYDGDCKKQYGRPFCVDSVCRECRESYAFDDCGGLTAFCNGATHFTCSTCSMDADCEGDSVCRAYEDPSRSPGSMPRFGCTKCHVPTGGVIISKSDCKWRCQLGQSLTGGVCLDCPVCGADQYLSPKHSPSLFFATCSNATDPVCSECASIGVNSTDSDFCASLIDQSVARAASEPIGDLGLHLPCRYFKCKAGWFLDLTMNKCKRCHLHMCPPGQFLSGCGETDPGQCVPCPGARNKPVQGQWIDATDKANRIIQPEDTCQFTCPRGMYWDKDWSGQCKQCQVDQCGRDPRIYNLK